MKGSWHVAWLGHQGHYQEPPPRSRRHAGDPSTPELPHRQPAAVLRHSLSPLHSQTCRVGLAGFTRRDRRPPPADETLIAELLGPSEPPTVRVLPSPAPQPQKEDEPRPAPQPQEDEPPPAPAALPAGEGGWLETQLALITAWSERMQKQIASSQADPDPWRCIAITTKGSQCKLIAEPGDTKCAIHGGHPDRLPVAQFAGHCRDASHSHPRQPSL